MKFQKRIAPWLTKAEKGAIMKSHVAKGRISLKIMAFFAKIKRSLKVKTMAVKKAALACSVCGSRNYSITANKNRTQRLELNKFCKHCGKKTLHKETR